jgi:glycine/D-amino acid oxidase-like deaminating enzyme
VSDDRRTGAEVVVVGAGICGAAAAFFLAERGAEVLLLDRGEVSSGTTGLGEGNVLVSDKPPGPERELALRGRELWLELGERFSKARVTRKGALVLGHPDGVDAMDLEPSLAPGTKALHDPDELQVDPRGLTQAMAAHVRVRTGAKVAAVAPGRVTLENERIDCDHVIVATGPWAAELTGLPVEPRKGQLVALKAPKDLIRHKLYAAAYIDTTQSAEAGLTMAPVIEQTLNGDEVLVGSSRERVGFDATVRPEVTKAMLQAAAAFVPALENLPITREWCGFRPWSPRGPLIGPIDDRVWVSTGHEGAGVCLGPISGLILAQLICGEAPELDPAPFQDAMRAS